jgi:signal peptidase I
MGCIYSWSLSVLILGFFPQVDSFVGTVAPIRQVGRKSFVAAKRTFLASSTQLGEQDLATPNNNYAAQKNVTLTFPPYLELMNLQSGQFATSDPFVCGGSKFCVKLYPRGGGHGAGTGKSDKVLLMFAKKTDEKVGMYLQYLGDQGTVDATFALRLQGRQRVGRKFNVEWRAGMRFVPRSETDLSKGCANDFGAHLMQTPLLKDFMGISDDQLDDPTPVNAQVEMTIHDIAKEQQRGSENSNEDEEAVTKSSFFGALGEDIRTPQEDSGFEHDPKRVRVGKVVVPVLGLGQRPRMMALGAYPGVEYRILRILKDGEERFTSCPGADYELKPIYPLVAQLERPWPVTVNEREIPKLFTASMYNAVAAIGSLFIAVFGLASAYLISQAVSLFFIPSRSMDPTLQVGDVLLVDKLSPRILRQQKVGDVVLFSPPSELRDIVSANGGKLTNRDLFVKRIAADPGSKVAVDAAGQVTVNDLPIVGRRDLCAAEPLRLIEKYLKPKEEVLESDQFFVMGDCSSVSIDSRVWGPLRSNEIIGKPILRLWPLERFGPVDALPLSTTEDNWTD